MYFVRVGAVLMGSWHYRIPGTKDPDRPHRNTKDKKNLYI